MLGTNDVIWGGWNQENFVKDYMEMASNFINLKSKPDVYLMIPPPMKTNLITNYVYPELIPKIAI